jgi:hypothetical protein
MWRPRRTFKGVMRWRMKDPPDLAMRCRFAPWQEKCEKEKRLRILPDAPGLLADNPFPIDHIIARQHGGPTIPENLALSSLHDYQQQERRSRIRYGVTRTLSPELDETRDDDTCQSGHDGRLSAAGTPVKN